MKYILKFNICSYLLVTVILCSCGNKNDISEDTEKKDTVQNQIKKRSIELDGNYSGTVNKITKLEIKISGFDGNAFFGESTVYWESPEFGYRVTFTGNYNADSYSIIIHEDKKGEGTGMFTGKVTADGRQISGKWTRYKDEKTFEWELSKIN